MENKFWKAINGNWVEEDGSATVLGQSGFPLFLLEYKIHLNLKYHLILTLNFRLIFYVEMKDSLH
jgi:hypothetical protein